MDHCPICGVSKPEGGWPEGSWKHELDEARAENLRHHRDFGRIDSILDAALRFGTLDHEQALHQIRNIVS